MMIEPVMVSASGLEARRFSLDLFQDERGSILPIEHLDDRLPFRPVRSFLIFDVPSVERRADHALLNCHELLVAVNGSMKVLLDSGTEVRTLTLDRSGAALYVPPMIWLSITEFSPAAVLYVLASEPYATTLRLRDRAEFQRQACRSNCP
jgi:UDP-2-acetamido-3-amino-2,3-dideoxy-glucuronate N-acetyltransferase